LIKNTNVANLVNFGHFVPVKPVAVGEFDSAQKLGDQLGDWQLNFPAQLVWIRAKSRTGPETSIARALGTRIFSTGNIACVFAFPVFWRRNTEISYCFKVFRSFSFKI